MEVIENAREIENKLFDMYHKKYKKPDTLLIHNYDCGIYKPNEKLKMSQIDYNCSKGYEIKEILKFVHPISKKEYKSEVLKFPQQVVYLQKLPLKLRKKLLKQYCINLDREKKNDILYEKYGKILNQDYDEESCSWTLAYNCEKIIKKINENKLVVDNQLELRNLVEIIKNLSLNINEDKVQPRGEQFLIHKHLASEGIIYKIQDNIYQIYFQTFEQFMVAFTRLLIDNYDPKIEDQLQQQFKNIIDYIKNQQNQNQSKEMIQQEYQSENDKTQSEQEQSDVENQTLNDLQIMNNQLDDRQQNNILSQNTQNNAQINEENLMNSQNISQNENANQQQQIDQPSQYETEYENLFNQCQNLNSQNQIQIFKDQQTQQPLIENERINGLETNKSQQQNEISSFFCKKEDDQSNIMNTKDNSLYNLLEQKDVKREEKLNSTGNENSLLQNSSEQQKENIDNVKQYQKLTETWKIEQKNDICHSVVKNAEFINFLKFKYDIQLEVPIIQKKFQSVKDFYEKHDNIYYEIYKVHHLKRYESLKNSKKRYQREFNICIEHLRRQYQEEYNTFLTNLPNEDPQ